MREQKRRQQDKKLDFSRRRALWNFVSTIYRQSTLVITSHIFDNGRDYQRQPAYVSDKEFTHRMAIFIVSGGICGFGYGQLFTELFGR